MNEFLADIYNTRESIGAPADTSDLDKLAEAQLLDETLRAEGIDIDKLPGDTILKLAHELLGDNSALVKAAAEEGAAHEKGESAEHEKGEEEEEEEKKASEETFEEKVAQADFLGRVMAHSFYNEKVGIEKDAGIKDFASKHFGKAKDFAKSVGSGAKRHAKDVGEGFKGLGHMARHPVEAGRAAKESVKSQGVKGTIKGSHKELKALGLTGAALAAAAAAASGGKEHRASALDVLAEKRAMAWAEAHGLIQNEDEAKLASAVDQRAAEMLAEAGIDVDAVEAATR